MLLSKLKSGNLQKNEILQLMYSYKLPYINYNFNDVIRRDVVYKTDKFELVNIYWKQGCSIPMHTHKTECWMKVHDGVLLEQHLEMYLQFNYIK